MVTKWARYPRPEPPNCSGTVAPSVPRSPSLRHISAGNWFSLSTASARGATSASANFLTKNRSSSSSSPNEGATMVGSNAGMGVAVLADNGEKVAVLYL